MLVGFLKPRDFMKILTLWILFLDLSSGLLNRTNPYYTPLIMIC